MEYPEQHPGPGNAIPPGFVSRKVAARRIGIAMKTLDRWLLTKKLEARLWRNRVVIAEESVEAWCRPRPYVRRRRRRPSSPAAPSVPYEPVQPTAAVATMAGT